MENTSETPRTRIGRFNMVNRKKESWRPPLFTASTDLASRFSGALRRLLDLQTASIWNDLALELPHVRGSVVDVGCGAQPFRTLFSANTNYIGIDTADAGAHFGYSVPDTRYFAGSTWPVEDASVDFILCTETLEHVLNVEEFLAEAARCLKSSGRILLTVPFSARWHYIPYDYWRFTPSSLKHVLEAAGFRDVAVYARGNQITVACYKINALILSLAMPQGRTFLMALMMRILSVPFIPLFLVLALIGQTSLHGKGGDDCIGYTATAIRR